MIGIKKTINKKLLTTNENKNVNKYYYSIKIRNQTFTILYFMRNYYGLDQIFSCVILLNICCFVFIMGLC